MICKYEVISIWLDKTNFTEGCSEFRKPTPRSLPYSVRRFPQTAGLPWMSGTESRGWTHCGHSFDIWASSGLQQRHLCYGGECLSKIDSLLCVSKNYPAGPVLFNGTVSLVFYLACKATVVYASFLDPFTAMDTFSNRQLCQLPSTILF